MNTPSDRPGSILQRIATSRLSKIVFFEEPMPRDLALTIRVLRRDYHLSYAEVMWALAESNPDEGQCHTFGQALTEQAHRQLKDGDNTWK